MIDKGLLSKLKHTYQLYRPVTNWRRFSLKERSKGCDHLFSTADLFSFPVFVSGCQRSGTTLVARAIRQSDQIADIDFTVDDELDAAYILSGQYDVDRSKRYCFQTTYINECYKKYATLKTKYYLIWVIRNPHSVVYSMVYNWARYPLNELFLSCGISEAVIQKKYTPVEKACYSYLAKNRQISWLMNNNQDGNILVIDYDDLIQNKGASLEATFDFIDLPYESKYSAIINSGSVDKSRFLGQGEVDIINEICGDSYLKVKELCKVIP